MTHAKKYISNGGMSDLLILCEGSIFVCFLFRASPAANGSSRLGIEWDPNGTRMGAAAAGLRHSHNNTRSDPHPQPIAQLTATPDP